MPHQWFRGVRIPDPDELEPVKMVGREEWGAVPPTETKFLKKPIRTLVFAFNTEMDTCTNLDDCKAAMKEMQTRHMELGYPDIYYNFAVGGDGRVYEGRGWHAWHSARYSVYYGRTLVVGIIGKGKDDDGDWFLPYGVGTLRIVMSGDEDHAFPYFEKDKLVYEMYDKILPYDKNDTTEIKLVNYNKDEEEDEECGSIKKKRRWWKKKTRWWRKERSATEFD